MPRAKKRAAVVLGNQLFEAKHWTQAGVDPAGTPLFMAEDLGLCTYFRHHQHKLVLFLAAMRSHRDALQKAGFDVAYRAFGDEDAEPETPYLQKLGAWLDTLGSVEELVLFEVEDRWFEAELEAWADARGLGLAFLQSPMFLTSREQFAEYLEDADGKPFMARFYQRQRRRLKLLMDDWGRPVSGKWSLDHENREKLPAGVEVPETSWAKPTTHVRDVCRVVADRFAGHPGDVGNFWLPTTRKQALAWLKAFLDDRFERFGPYEDALSNRDPVLFHSALSPVLNLGLLTPREVVAAAVDHARKHEEAAGEPFPLNSLEGFVRQVIGWREFVRGVYGHFDEEQDGSNRWDNHRKPTRAWWDGTTGVPPLDDAIRKANRLGWTHHIERLMVMGNLFNLCEIEPREAHRWFMEMYVDSSDWVMGPNVYGMGLCSDGGIFATKPYICGSSYLVKMSDSYKKTGKGNAWADAVDGLYWRFIDKHRDFFNANPRMAVMVGTYDKMKPERKKTIREAGEALLDRITTA
ncbi:cryptochrome/photolyase family protein [Phycisphaera mikurensis]|uniref:Cryptochrome/DNA photolyase FAD-binding domain-containing protein n=1 Tax=Phycisphaera mikurensis (strain NBRC 102666 / KCTC 22515 / FYK2301M01) TaxID=1142394 RepID=I0ICH6_PHYMF|nr:cryptochrome/photolyase family protein [Phycisphaera mikurensis]MBB6442160.1 deoxyribodipyrimidine photolyase-related protein [Phycisphaera mikurensis]BAM02964.1 hypothetical protein PSMK_08050 [Phycisphaera mikurensis NBRC 102666]